MTRSKFGDKIMLIADYTEAIMYRAACACIGSEHDLWIEAEFDKKLQMVFITFYKDVHYIQDSSEDGMLDKIKGFMKRCKDALRLIFTGHLKMNEDFILQGEDHINGFIEMLSEGKNLLTKGGEENVKGDFEETHKEEKRGEGRGESGDSSELP